MDCKDIQRLEKMCEELKHYSSLLDEVQAEVDKRREEIKELIGDSEEEIFAGDFKVSYKSVESERIDSKGLKKQFPEIAKMFSKVSVARRLLIK